MGTMKTIDDISREKTVLDGAERFVGRDDSGDFKITGSNMRGSINNGWTSVTDTWTYSSADSPSFTFTIPGDVTGAYWEGMKVKLTIDRAGKYKLTSTLYLHTLKRSKY